MFPKEHKSNMFANFIHFYPYISLCIYFVLFVVSILRLFLNSNLRA